MITTILFDLDGTLLPMDQEVFLKEYIKGLAATAAPYGYEPKEFSKSVMVGTAAMIKNDGSKTNEEVFWDCLAGIYGEKVQRHTHIFDEFYETDFQKIKEVCGFTPQAAELIKYIKKKGYRVVLATNPFFPSVATESRMRWAGLEPEDFEYYSIYENSHYCKPNLDYFREVLSKIDASPEECLMVGNDAHEDMIAEQLGMKVFLLTDCLINKENKDIAQYPQGSFGELKGYIESISKGE